PADDGGGRKVHGGDQTGRHPPRDRRARTAGYARPQLRWKAGGDRRAVHRDEGAGRRVRSHRGEVARRGDRVGQAIPEDRRRRRERRPGSLRGLDASVTATDAHHAIDAVWRIESPRLIAGLTRIVRDVGVAEDLAQDALVAALEQWPKSGVPDNPGAWLMATAKHRAIDRLRRSQLLERQHAAPGPELAARLSSVLEVVYLIFNEGYSATAGDEWMRPALCEDALRIGRILAELASSEAEVHGLVALMEIQASRSKARVGPSGEPILLFDQNRAHWDQLLIRRGLAALTHVEKLGCAQGQYVLQAEIAACHARARTPEATNWP